MDMDLSSMWLPELETEDGGFMTQYDNMHNPYDMVDSFSSENIQEKESSIERFFSYQIGSTPNTVAATTDHSSSNTNFTISFRDIKAKREISLSDDYESVGTRKAPTLARSQDHVLAERKRREKLNQQFISMSALLPNLKKMDKASVLEEATNYIRELQDRMKELEASSGPKRKEDDSSPNETKSGDHSAGVPSKSSAEIEVRISGGSVLVRIYSHKTYSLTVKVLSQMQRLGFNIINSSTMPFANTITVITILAQIEEDFVMTAADLVNKLQLS